LSRDPGGARTVGETPREPPGAEELTADADRCIGLTYRWAEPVRDPPAAALLFLEFGAELPDAFCTSSRRLRSAAFFSSMASISFLSFSFVVDTNDGSGGCWTAARRVGEMVGVCLRPPWLASLAVP
jgi:hypothetical protein